MPQLPFIKMHGAENDYVFFDGLTGPLPQAPQLLAPRLCDRHAAVGADGIICLLPPDDSDCDVEMRIWNADGSAAEMCGNAARCIAVWMQQHGRVAETCRIRVADRIVTAEQIRSEAGHGDATVNMGPPQLPDPPAGRRCQLHDGSAVTVNCVRIGNPHAVVFVSELSDDLVRSVGPQLEHHPDLAERTNVEFARTLTHSQLQLRVWERGSGETRACGSGACAAVSAGVHTGHLHRDTLCQVELPGGTLDVTWNSDGDLLLAGPVTIAYTGHVSV